MGIRDFGKPWGKEQTPRSSGAASRDLLCSPRSPITPPSRHAMRSLRTSSSGKVRGDGGGGGGGREGEGQIGEGLEHTLVSFLPSLSLSFSLSQPNPRHEVEEQVLGQILGDCACGDRQRQPAQVGVPKCSAVRPSPWATLQSGVARW